MNFILKGKLKHYTKDVIKTLEIVFLSILFIALIILIKYKPVYTVTLSGETLGYVKEKSDLENRINEYINKKEGTIALIDIEIKPKYSLELVSKKEITSEEDIFEKIQETAIITYKTYAITVNGEAKLEVNTEIEAQDAISKLSEGLNESVDFKLGYVEVYKTQQTAISEDVAISSLNEIKLAKVSEFEAEQERLEQERLAAEQAKKAEEKRLAAERKKLVASSVSYGNVNGMEITTPLKVRPLITSRFGERSRSRRSSHTGLDLATSLGTPIYPIAGGKVTFAGNQGSYGKMIIIDHGNGIQSWYAHCNSLNVGVGSSVTTDTLIATVGSTGNSTGPHLHLEIRVNGSAVNPQNYLY